MTAYQSARYYDYLERQQWGGEPLNEREQRDFKHLDALARKEWENAREPFMYGGDYLDVF